MSEWIVAAAITFLGWGFAGWHIWYWYGQARYWQNRGLEAEAMLWKSIEAHDKAQKIFELLLPKLRPMDEADEMEHAAPSHPEKN